MAKPKNRFSTLGTMYLFRGLRSGRSGMAGIGALFAAIGLLRRLRGADKELLYRRDLKPGETLRVRFVRGEIDEVPAGEA